MMADRYKRELANNSDIVDHLPYFVQTCVDLDATRVIELGVRGGVSTIAWLHGLELSDGHLWSVDISPAPEDLQCDRWSFLEGDDLDDDIVKSLPNQVDVVFIDTSHLHVQTLRELETYCPKVRRGGRILLHDSELAVPEGALPGDPDYPVKAAVQEFCDRQHLFWSNRPQCWGLVTIEVH